jgi:hypothetical protein
LGLFILVKYSLKNSIKKILIGLFIAFAGLSFPIFYIVLVETALNFKKLSIPTFFDQLIEYSKVVNILISSFEGKHKLIYDLRVWNRFILIILIFNTLVFSIFVFYNKNKIIKKFPLNLSINLIGILSSISIFLLFSIFYSFPITRSMVPILFVFNIFISLYLSYIIITINNKIFTITTVTLTTIFLIVNSYSYIFKTFGNGYIDDYNPNSLKVLDIKDMGIIWNSISLFHKSHGSDVMSSGQLGVYSLSLENFLKLKGVDCNNPPSDLMLRVFPLDLVEAYSHTRRFIPQMVNNPLNIVTTSVMKNDFALFFSIFERLSSGYIGDDAFFVKDIIYWHPSFFDQEYNYIYGYNKKVKNYLFNTSMQNVDFRKIYYFKVSQLCRVLKLDNK